MEHESIFTISILDSIYSLSQNKGEPLEEFKIRLQEYFNKNNVNIIIG